MGMGMTVVVSKDVSESVEKWLNQRLPGSRYVGYVHDRGNEVTHLDPEVTFSHY